MTLADFVTSIITSIITSMKPSTLARLDTFLRPLLTRLPPALVVRLYSRSRGRFIASFSHRPPAAAFAPEELSRTLWELEFRAPILNAAGMFKNGGGAEVVWRQGAGAFLAGTTTDRPRRGNRRHGVDHPFAPYPRSHAASNWLGLPNPGHREVARRLAEIPRRPGFPLGASVASSAEDGESPEERLEVLIRGMTLYAEAGVDFLEINESCPNTDEDPEELGELRDRLAHVRDKVLSRRTRRLPVMVKFSCDTRLQDVPDLVGLLVEPGFDGVNFGNTSTAYDAFRPSIALADRPLYDDFSSRFGGGLSGRPLKDRSLALASAAVEEIRKLAPEREFHVVRTGGIENAADLHRSAAAGIALNQWYTGYFEAFAHHGHAVYRKLYEELREG